MDIPIESFYHFLLDLSLDLHLGQNIALLLTHIIIAISVFLLCWLTNLVARKLLLKYLHQFVKKTKNTWDDMLFDKHVFDWLSHLVPAVMLFYAHRLYPSEFETLRGLIVQASLVYIILVVTLTIFSFLNAIQAIYDRYEFSKGRPIKGYLQAVKILLIILTLLLMVSLIVDRSPIFLLSGMGALTAILLLVFKDSILGVVAGIQIAGNNLVQVGDWIVVPGANADGDVIDVSLTTVKVQNWDKTITSVPIYHLVSQAFTNWRGMFESGGRRIKRHISLDINTVHFADDDLLDRLSDVTIIEDRIKEIRDQLKLYEAQEPEDKMCPFNAPRPTNAGLFRDYAAAFLQQNDNIHKDMTFLVRQLQPQEIGLPIEVYVFCKDQRWVHYETIQGEIFDHLIAVLPHFGLRAFQRPSGKDFTEARYGEPHPTEAREPLLGQDK